MPEHGRLESAMCFNGENLKATRAYSTIFERYSTEKKCAPLAAIIIYDQLSESGSHGDVSCHYVSSNMARRCDRVKCTAYESRNCGFG